MSSSLGSIEMYSVPAPFFGWTCFGRLRSFLGPFIRPHQPLGYTFGRGALVSHSAPLSSEPGPAPPLPPRPPPPEPPPGGIIGLPPLNGLGVGKSIGLSFRN